MINAEGFTNRET